MRHMFAVALLVTCVSLPYAGAQSAAVSGGDAEATRSALDSATKAGPDRDHPDQNHFEAIEPSGDSEAKQPGVSQVRIVRLSEVRGQAQLDRNTGRGFEAAFANIPITAGARLRTETGLAEVEFEDNSTLRLTPDSTVTFTELSRTAAGATVTRVNVGAGTLYASLTKAKGNTFEIAVGDQVLQLSPGAHIRLNAPGAGRPGALAVLDGSVQIEQKTPGGALATLTTVGKRKSLELAASVSSASSQTASSPSQTAPLLLSKVEDQPFDEWDKTEADYQKHFAKAAFSGGAAYLFGASDLDYYGSFSNLGSCGRLWRPYFTSAAWSPYDNGVWAWYPGAGYSWVSPYPWGWLPFHSGAWVNCPSGGWGWRPGGVWQGLGNAPRHIRPVNVNPAGPGNPVQHPKWPRPPLPPMPGKPTLVASGTRPLLASGITGEGTWTFRQNSAGFGVPRQTFGNLSHVSRTVDHHGFASQAIENAYIGPPPSAREGGRNAAAGQSSAWTGAHEGGAIRSATPAYNGTATGQVSVPHPTHGGWNNGYGSSGSAHNGGGSGVPSGGSPGAAPGASHGSWGGGGAPGGGSHGGSSRGPSGSWGGGAPGGYSGGHMGGATPSAPAAAAPAASGAGHK